MIALMLYSANRGKNSPNLGLKDFMPDRGNTRSRNRIQSPEEMAAMALDLAIQSRKKNGE